MPDCLLIEPIHPDAVAALKAGGLTLRQASAADEATLAAEIAGCAAVITRAAPITARIMDAGKDLLVIGNHGAGVDPVDVPAASARGIAVVNTPGANSVSVAEHAMALLLGVARWLPSSDAAVRALDRDYKYTRSFFELRGRRLAILGFGNSGQALAGMAANGFGMKVTIFARARHRNAIRAAGYSYAASPEEAVADADAVSIHLPLNGETRHLVGDRLLAAMKEDAVLVNVARGAIVDEKALARALDQGQIAGAGLDVFDGGLPQADYPLLKHEKVVLSPHIAGQTGEAARATGIMTVAGVLAALEGERPEHLYNPESWEAFTRRRR